MSNLIQTLLPYPALLFVAIIVWLIISNGDFKIEFKKHKPKK